MISELNNRLSIFMRLSNNYYLRHIISDYTNTINEEQTAYSTVGVIRQKLMIWLVPQNISWHISSFGSACDAQIKMAWYGSSHVLDAACTDTIVVAYKSSYGRGDIHFFISTMFFQHQILFSSCIYASLSRCRVVEQNRFTRKHLIPFHSII